MITNLKTTVITSLWKLVVQFTVFWKCSRFSCPLPTLSGQFIHSPSFIDIHDACDWAICSPSVPTIVHPPVMKIYGHVWRPWRLIIISRRTRRPSLCTILLKYLSSGPGRHIYAYLLTRRTGGRLTAARTSIKRVIMSSARHYSSVITGMQPSCTHPVCRWKIFRT